MTQPLPPGQGPVDPRGAFSMPPVPGQAAPGAWMPPGAPAGAPVMYPAMMMPAYPPPPRRRVGLWIFTILLIVGLVVSVLVNVAQLGGAARRVHQTVISGEGADKVAVAPVDGLIDDNSAANFDLVLKDIEKDTAVKALVVEIDTPGGSATASAEMYHRLEEFKTRKHVPVVIAMRGMATSGGYYVACGGDYLFAEPSTLTGNIGVLFPRFNMSQMLDKWGVQETTLTATTVGHSYKNAGSMFQPENKLDEEYLQGLVDGIFVQFKAVVQAGRQGRLNDKEGDAFSGKAFIAADALDRGLIDQIGYPEAAYDYAAKAAGLTTKVVVRYSPNPSLFQLLTARSNVPAGESQSSARVNIDGVSVDAQAVEDLLSSRPLLLWRGN